MVASSPVQPSWDRPPGWVAGPLRRVEEHRLPGHAIDVTVDGPATAARAPLELAVLGDSVANGVGARDPRLALPVQLAEQLAVHVRRSVTVAGHGRPGARTEDVAVEQAPRLRARPAEAAVVIVGSNDVVLGTPPWRVLRWTRRLLDALAEHVSGTVLLCGNVRFDTVTAIGPLLRRAANTLAVPVGCAQRQAARGRPEMRFVDLAAAVGDRFRATPAAMSADGFHPGPLGHRLLAETLARTLAQELSHRQHTVRRQRVGQPWQPRAGRTAHT